MSLKSGGANDDVLADALALAAAAVCPLDALSRDERDLEAALPADDDLDAAAPVSSARLGCPLDSPLLVLSLRLRLFLGDAGGEHCWGSREVAGWPDVATAPGSFLRRSSGLLLALSRSCCCLTGLASAAAAAVAPAGALLLASPPPVLSWASPAAVDSALSWRVTSLDMRDSNELMGIVCVCARSMCMYMR